MNQDKKAEALRLADCLRDKEYCTFLQMLDAANLLERQHACIAELEAELAAVKGAPAAQEVEPGVSSEVDALVTAAFIEGGVSAENTEAARQVTEQRKQELQAAIAALRVTPPAPAAVAVPAGWKLVPCEPQDMQQAAGAQAIRFDTTLINKMWTANKVYREMIASAPECAALAAPQAQDVQDAVRYRWLRENAADFLTCVVDATGRLCCNSNEADEAVDHAIAASAKGGV